MPGLVPLRRSRSSLEDDEDIYHDDHSDRDASPQVDAQNKRARLELDVDRNETPDATDSSSPPQTAIRNQLAARNSHGDAARVLANEARRITPEHKPGAIVRVTLTNFVTYAAASFYPGPALNMVIGPNGTGKSTLVCAICLGLGWGPKHLGRAKDPGEFVKHGSSEATIEIELKGRPGKRNPVIRRLIKREGNKSSYLLNGDASSQGNVRSLAQQFGIQVDNLCHFLPQDRVVEFAGLSPVDRLESTQRAAAPEYMTQWHEELKRLRVEQKNGERLQSEVKHNLTNLEGRQNLQRADVERIREREMLVQKVAMLEKMKPFAEQAALRLKHEAAKDRKQTLKEEFLILKKRDAPLLRAVNAKQDYKDNVEKAVNVQKNLLDRTVANLDACSKKMKEATRSIEDCKAKVTSERKQETERKKNIGTVQNEIQDIEQRMREPQINFDVAACNEGLSALRRNQREVMEEVVDMNKNKTEHNISIKQKEDALKEAQKALEDLKTQAGQQLRKLAHMSPDTAKAWKWVESNRDKLKGDVYGPAILECTVTDMRFVDHMEMLLHTKPQLCAITCTDPEDFRNLQNQFTGHMKLSDVSLRTANRPVNTWHHPIRTAEEMSRLGLQGWALSYLAGPEPVLSMLCDEAQLHAAGVTLDDITQAQYLAISDSPVSTWVTKSSSHRITRRREYVGAVSTAVTAIKKAEYFVQKGVDVEAERRIKDTIVNLGSEIEDLKKSIGQRNDKIYDLKLRMEKMKEEYQELEAEKAEKAAAVSAQRALPQKLASAQNRVAELNASSANIVSNIMALAEEENGHILRKGQLAIDYSTTVDAIRKLYIKFIEARVAQIEANSDFEGLTLRNRTIKEELETKQKEVSEADKLLKGLRESYKRIVEHIQGIFAQDPELHSYISALPQEEQERTPEELELEIDAQKARLELLHEGDPRAIREFEARAVDIERLQRQAADYEEKLAAVEQSIAEIRGKWETELDVLVDKISAAFSASLKKISCDGAVAIEKEGTDGRDFGGWAISILVKFREDEPLAKLDSHRQSGGERAVSTIFYLMALQSLSRAPFRVVDEINQGMDPRNERMVHERMVDIACGHEQVGEDDEELITGTEEGNGQVSQYFLITPKLLSDLKYKPGMTVHCIASGEFMPEDYKQLDFKGLLEKAKKVFGVGRSLVGGVGA